MKVYCQGYTRLCLPECEWQIDVEEFNAFREAFLDSIQNDPEKIRKRDLYFASHKPATPAIRLFLRLRSWWENKKNQRREREELLQQDQKQRDKNDLEQRKRNAYLKQGVTPKV
jgi:hypothetical protein